MDKQAPRWWRHRSLWLIGGIVVAAAAVMTFWLMAQFGSGHDSLLAELDELLLPTSVVSVVDRRIGPSHCFAGDCPSVDRYYASPVDPDATCRDLERVSEEWNLHPLAVGSNGACTIGGVLPSGTQIRAVVTGPIKEIPAYGNTVYPTPVDVKHRAILLIGAS